MQGSTKCTNFPGRLQAKDSNHSLDEEFRGSSILAGGASPGPGSDEAPFCRANFQELAKYVADEHNDFLLSALESSAYGSEWREGYVPDALQMIYVHILIGKIKFSIPQNPVEDLILKVDLLRCARYILLKITSIKENRKYSRPGESGSHFPLGMSLDFLALEEIQTPADILIDKEMSEIAWQLVAEYAAKELKGSRRKVVNLWQRGKSLKEIGIAVGVPPSLVKREISEIVAEISAKHFGTNTELETNHQSET